MSSYELLGNAQAVQSSGSSYGLLGSVQAIQYTGSNVAAIRALLDARWIIYTADSGTNIALSTRGNESLTLGGLLIQADQWLVSQPSYDNTAPAISGGFSILSNSQFTQQYR